MSSSFRHFFPSVNPTCYLKYQQNMSTQISIKTIKHLIYILGHSQKLIQTVASFFVCYYASIISFSVNEL